MGRELISFLYSDYVSLIEEEEEINMRIFLTISIEFVFIIIYDAAFEVIFRILCFDSDFYVIRQFKSIRIHSQYTLMYVSDDTCAIAF